MSEIFYKITNQEIYNKLIEIEKEIKNIKSYGKVNRWISTTSLSLTFLLIGYCLASL